MAKKEVINISMSIPLEIYPRKIFAFYGEAESFKKYAKKFFKDEDEWRNLLGDIDDCYGFCIEIFKDDGTLELIYVDSERGIKNSMSTVWHESLHASIDILSAVGIQTTKSNQEPLAYLQGYIATKIIEKIEMSQKLSNKVAQKRAKKLSEDEN